MEIDIDMVRAMLDMVLFHTFALIDDGTMDTVIRCLQCGRDERYTWDSEGFYDSFVDWAFTNAMDSHECHQLQGSFY